MRERDRERLLVCVDVFICRTANAGTDGDEDDEWCVCDVSQNCNYVKVFPTLRHSVNWGDRYILHSSTYCNRCGIRVTVLTYANHPYEFRVKSNNPCMLRSHNLRLLLLLFCFSFFMMFVTFQIERRRLLPMMATTTSNFSRMLDGYCHCF